MGNYFNPPLHSAETRTYTADSGGAIFNPLLRNVHVRGDLHLTTNVTPTHDPSPAETTDPTADPPDNKEYIQRCQAEHKSFLKNETMNLFQGTKEDGSTPLDKIYTELYITKGGSGEVHTEHEVIELECKRFSCVENKINLNDIFQPLPNEDNLPRTVLTEGIAGIGKTVSVLKFTQDWSKDEANRTTQFLFPFTFRELNLIKEETLSLMTLITSHFKEVKDLKASDYDNLTVLFIFDGLDESQLPLDFNNNKVCRCVTEKTTVDVLLTNLIKGKLMHNASVWITSRPAASAKIPPNFIHRVTEIRGFNDEQKEEYFQKEVSDKEMAQKILDHLQSKPLRSLYIMCHIPVFCWISATVLQSLLTETHRGELPKTVTEMYTDFLIVQTKMTLEKNYPDREADKVLIMKLGKLAFEELQKGNIIFDENDLKRCEIDLTHAAVYSGVCTQIIKKERGLHKIVMYCFIHLSVQEFLAALYVLETFIESGENLLPSKTGMKMKGEFPILFLHKNAVDRALADTKGQWDLFLRFLLGLSQDNSQKLIQKAFGFKEGRLGSNEETINYMHEKIKKLSYADQSVNLFHCLNEVGDQSLVQQVQSYQRSGDVSKISPAHWSAVAYLLLVSNEELDLFDLKKYCKSEDVLERLLPVLKVSKKALLSDCELTERCCRYMSSVLMLKSCGLEELDLSRNDLQDSGMRLLSEGLKSPNCKLQKLTLNECHITKEGCRALADALTSNPSHLRELDLSKNKFQDEGLELLSGVLNRCSLETLRLCTCGITGLNTLAVRLGRLHLKTLDLSKNRLGGPLVQQLSNFLKDPDCRLERLSLFKTNLQKESAAALICALAQKHSYLRELDLGGNYLGDDGVKKVANLIKFPDCRVETLRLAGCHFSEVGCVDLASSLRSNPAYMRVLDLARNDLQDAGVDCISKFLAEPLCKLEKLNLKFCLLTADSCSYLAPCFPSTLKELDLSYNQQTDRGVELLCDWLRQPECCLEILRSLSPAHRYSSDCRVETLRLAGCQFSEVGCVDLASSLRSNPAYMRVLDLARNDLQDAGVNCISKFLAEPLCKLEKLNLKCCSLTADSCSYLAPCFPSTLKELDLSYNQQTDRGVELLCDWLRQPECCLEILRLSSVTDSGCTSLASALTLKSSHLRELDLNKTDPGGSGALQLSQIQREDGSRLQTLTVAQ